MGSPYQRIVDQLKDDQTSTEVIRKLLHHEAGVIRVNALEALARRVGQHEGLVDDLVHSASEPVNAAPLMGTIRVSHVAVAALLRTGNARAAAAAHRLIDAWPESDRSDLLWYLRSEGLLDGSDGKAGRRQGHEPARAP